MNGKSQTPRECTFRAGAGGTKNKPPLAGSTTRCYEKASDAVRVYRFRQYSISACYDRPGLLSVVRTWAITCVLRLNCLNACTAELFTGQEPTNHDLRRRGKHGPTPRALANGRLSGDKPKSAVRKVQCIVPHTTAAAAIAWLAGWMNG